MGNGVTNWQYDTNAAYVEMGYWHSLYSQELRDNITAADCNFGGVDMANMTSECEGYFDTFMTLVSDVNIYDIFGTCWGTDDYPALNTNGKKYKGMT